MILLSNLVLFINCSCRYTLNHTHALGIVYSNNIIIILTARAPGRLRSASVGNDAARGAIAGPVAVGQGLGAKARGRFKNAPTGRHSASCTLYNMSLYLYAYY